MLDAVNKPVVNLVGNHEQVVFFCEFGNLQRVFTRKHRTGRIVRITDKDRFRVRRNQRFDLFRRDLEIVFGAARHGHGNAVGKKNFRLVSDKTRRRHDDLVARIADRAENAAHRFADADRDHHFAVRAIRDAVQIFEMFREFFAQFHQTRICRVIRHAAQNGIESGLKDRLRGDEIGFADTERDHVGHLRGNAEKSADSRRFYFMNAVGDKAVAGG